MAEHNVVGIQAECLGRLLTGRIDQGRIIDSGQVAPLIQHVPLRETMLRVALNQRHCARPRPGRNAQLLACRQ